MVPEAELEQTQVGLVAKGDGWFVLNARDARWHYTSGRGGFCDLEGDQTFPQLGINIQVLQPGDPMAMYHWEADQEDFLVLAGEALLIIEGQERPLRSWDFVHARRRRIIRSSAPATVLASSSRSAPARTRTARVGAGTRWTRQRCATTLVSSRRPPSQTRPMHPSGRKSASASPPGTARVGFPASSASFERPAGCETIATAGIGEGTEDATRWRDDDKLGNLTVSVLDTAADAEVVFDASNDLSRGYAEQYGYVTKAEEVDDLGDEAWVLLVSSNGRGATYHWRRANLVIEAHVDCHGTCPWEVETGARAWADAIDAEARNR
jgi:hypothetical protein